MDVDSLVPDFPGDPAPSIETSPIVIGKCITLRIYSSSSTQLRAALVAGVPPSTVRMFIVFVYLSR